MTTEDKADNFVLIVRQPSTGSNSANEVAEDTLETPLDDQTSVEDFSEQIPNENHLKVPELKCAADTSCSSRRGSIFSQTIVLSGTLKWFYLIIPLLLMAFTVGVFFGGILCKLLES